LGIFVDKWIAVFIFFFAAVCAQASDDHQPSMETSIICSDSWYRYIEHAVTKGPSYNCDNVEANSIEEMI